MAALPGRCSGRPGRCAGDGAASRRAPSCGCRRTAAGTQWTRAGHELVVSGRDPAKAQAIAERIGRPSRAGTFAEAVEFGSVVPVAVPASAIPEVLSAAGAEAGWSLGKVLVDCSNAFVPGCSVPDLPAGSSMAEQIAERAVGSKVVKAFNLCHESVWRLSPPVFDGRPLLVPLCGDDPAAIETVRSLVADIGCEPADGGPLERAALVEATAVFAVGLWVGGADLRRCCRPPGRRDVTVPGSGADGSVSTSWPISTRAVIIGYPPQSSVRHFVRSRTSARHHLSRSGRRPATSVVRPGLLRTPPGRCSRCRWTR